MVPRNFYLVVFAAQARRRMLLLLLLLEIKSHLRGRVGGPSKQANRLEEEKEKAVLFLSISV